MKTPAALLATVAALAVPVAGLRAQNPAVAPAPTAPAASPAPANTGSLKTPKDKLSYAIGMDVASSLKRIGAEVDPAVVALAFKDTYVGGPTQLTEAQVKEALMAFQQDLVAKRQTEAKAAGDKAKGEGDAFLAANKTKEGVKTTASGLQYKVITEGTGATPTTADTVSCHYRGTLVNGTEFDASRKHGDQPVSFPVTGVIKGWTEALQLMKVGSKYQLFIPSDLAYGEPGRPPIIPPASALIFDIELIGIQGK